LQGDWLRGRNPDNEIPPASLYVLSTKCSSLLRKGQMEKVTILSAKLTLEKVGVAVVSHSRGKGIHKCNVAFVYININKIYMCI
jgi:hypothetical protein